ncbi:MAG: GNAT family N-acetyltransferase [Candidatus Bipolaricaulota bacterium]
MRSLYGAAFGDAPWPEDWDRFERFDPHGVFVARNADTDHAVGFCVSFCRDAFGYISVVAVLPECRRAGVASALVHAACAYLRGLGLAAVKVDAFTDSLPAVHLYEHMGFTVESTFPDPEWVAEESQGDLRMNPHPDSLLDPSASAPVHARNGRRTQGPTLHDHGGPSPSPLSPLGEKASYRSASGQRIATAARWGHDAPRERPGRRSDPCAS